MSIIRLVILLAAPALTGEFTAQVVGVTDGDTLTVLTAEKTRVKIRLHGIDAPETGQDFGARAKQAASDLAFGKQVTVRERDRDRYGRTVAEVFLPDGRSLNRELVRRGMAWWYKQYAPGDEDLARLEGEARGGKAGLWGRAGAVPPWEWRRGGTAPAVSGLVGNRRSMVYHLPACTSVRKMSDKNRMVFGTADEAEAAGYRKAGDCR